MAISQRAHAILVPVNMYVLHARVFECLHTSSPWLGPIQNLTIKPDCHDLTALSRRVSAIVMYLSYCDVAIYTAY